LILLNGLLQIWRWRR